MYEHAIDLLRRQAPTLSHEGRRDALTAAEALENPTRTIILEPDLQAFKKFIVQEIIEAAGEAAADPRMFGSYHRLRGYRSDLASDRRQLAMSILENALRADRELVSTELVKDVIAVVFGRG